MAGSWVSVVRAKVANTTAVVVTATMSTTALAPVVDRIAQVWNTTWQLTAGLKPETLAKHFPSSGPYRIDSVLDGGAVVR